ncbi:MAG: M50 family metallopeptidase [Candidatus Methanoperedens sp.]|nr:M50 family metallopeptidase [Candidatus Methanoperedens sp.]
MDRKSSRELIHLIVSLVVLTIAFTFPNLDPRIMLIVGFGVGTGFILHELAHKFTAQRYGYVADYEASPMGLLLALGLSLLTKGSFVFAAPGAVMIRGRNVLYSPQDDRYWNSIQTAKEIAYISVSGAVVNLLLAMMFFAGSIFVSDPLVDEVLKWAAFINVFLAGFNMIPFGPLDGAKVWRYNPVLWLMIGIPSIILFLLIR